LDYSGRKGWDGRKKKIGKAKEKRKKGKVKKEQKMGRRMHKGGKKSGRGAPAQRGAPPQVSYFTCSRREPLEMSVTSLLQARCLPVIKSNSVKTLNGLSRLINQPTYTTHL